MSPTGRRRLVGASLVLAASGLSAALLALPHSAAGFIDTTDNIGNSIAADTLDPPGGLTAVPNAGNIDLNWTATPDSYADGYNIYRSSTPGGPYSFLDSVVGQGTTTYSDVGATAGATVFETVATATTNGSSIAIAKPAGTVDGDLLIAIVAGEIHSATLSPPAGWTQIFQTLSPGNFVAGAWYRIASGEPASFTFGSTESHAMNAGILRYSNAHPTAPIDASAAVAGFGNPTAPNVSTTASNTAVLRVGILEDATIADIDYPAGTTGLFEIDIDPGQVTSAADSLQAAPGATGTAAFTGGSDDYIASTIAIRGGSYYYVVRAYADNWESVDSNSAP